MATLPHIVPAVAGEVREPVEPPSIDNVYRDHYDLIATYIYRRTGSRHATEEIVSNVFFEALRSLPTYRDRGLPIRCWLYRIATRELGRWTSRRRRRAALQRIFAGRAAPVASHAAAETAADELRAALGALRAEYQDVLVLHHAEGLSVEQIAEVIERPVGTVKSRLARGREALRRAMEPGAGETNGRMA